jgi:hypothetical protein
MLCVGEPLVLKREPRGGVIALLYIHAETAAIAARAAIHRRLPTQRLHGQIRENVDGRKLAITY